MRIHELVSGGSFSLPGLRHGGPAWSLWPVTPSLPASLSAAPMTQLSRSRDNNNMFQDMSSPPHGINIVAAMAAADPPRAPAKAPTALCWAPLAAPSLARRLPFLPLFHSLAMWGPPSPVCPPPPPRPSLTSILCEEPHFTGQHIEAQRGEAPQSCDSLHNLVSSSFSCPQVIS